MNSVPTHLQSNQMSQQTRARSRTHNRQSTTSSHMPTHHDRWERLITITSAHNVNSAAFTAMIMCIIMLRYTHGVNVWIGRVKFPPWQPDNYSGLSTAPYRNTSHVPCVHRRWGGGGGEHCVKLNRTVPEAKSMQAVCIDSLSTAHTPCMLCCTLV